MRLTLPSSFLPGLYLQIESRYFFTVCNITYNNVYCINMSDIQLSVRVPQQLKTQLDNLLSDIQPQTSMNSLLVYLIQRGIQYDELLPLADLVSGACQVITDKGYSEDEFDRLLDWFKDD